MAKSNMVTRRVTAGRNYDVFVINSDGEGMKKIGSIIEKGKPDKESIAKQFKVERVVLVETGIVKKVYGVSVDEFMKIAKEVTPEEAEEAVEQ